ncbi:MAG TPA: GAF domain-containing protein, partial [Gemmatimonadaceae bacterium]
MTSPARLAALHNTGLLETAADDRLDVFTRLAAQVLDVSTVLISLVDAKRQYFKSVAGNGGSPSAGWNPLDASLCQDVVGTGMPLVMPDARNDPVLADGGTKVAAYAGVPLITEDGHVLGALCAFDQKPRDWSERDLGVLTALSTAVMSEIQRRVAARAVQDTQLRLIAERTLSHAVQQQMPVGVVVAEVPSGRLVSVNAQMTEIFRTSFTPSPDLHSYNEWVGFRESGTPLAALEWPLARTVLSGEVVRGEEIRILRGDGSDGYIRMSS